LPPGRQDRRLHGDLPLTKSDAGLATVLGHEVAHATAEHVAERIERQHLTKVAAIIIAGGVAFTPQQFAHVVALLGVGGEAASLPFSRKQESEADHIGLIYMAKAGYDPRQAVAFWKRLAQATKGKEPPEFASDHPTDQHRVERIRSWLPEAERAYRPA
jgi:metalloendopeptidase OMA1, mitochondrial